MKTPKDLYIITTARKRDTLEWEDECLPFLISKDKTKSYDGVELHVDSWNKVSQYTDVENAFFIFDEQKVVGYGTWTKSFLKIAKKNNWILLSATPGDTWMDYVPVFIANGFYKNKTEFVRRHVVFSRFSKYPKVERYIDTGRLECFRKKILVEMPCKRHTVRHNCDIFVDHSSETLKILTEDRWNFYDMEPIRDAGQLCYLMRRVVNTDPSRLTVLTKLTEAHPKSIIFYNFDYELALLREWAETTYTPYAEWNGHRHEPIPETDRWVYLVQYTSGAEGWNCIKTDTIIFYSQNYSYKVVEQASGRIDRLNTPFIDLWYYHLKSKSSIDMAISRKLKSKKAFNEKAFASFFDSQE